MATLFDDSLSLSRLVRARQLQGPSGRGTDSVRKPPCSAYPPVRSQEQLWRVGHACDQELLCSISSCACRVASVQRALRGWGACSERARPSRAWAARFSGLRATLPSRFESDSFDWGRQAGHTLEGSFSAVSIPIYASKLSCSSFFRNLQEYPISSRKHSRFIGPGLVFKRFAQFQAFLQ